MAATLCKPACPPIRTELYWMMLRPHEKNDRRESPQQISPSTAHVMTLYYLLLTYAALIERRNRAARTARNNCFCGGMSTGARRRDESSA